MKKLLQIKGGRKDMVKDMGIRPYTVDSIAEIHIGTKYYMPAPKAATQIIHTINSQILAYFQWKKTHPRNMTGAAIRVKIIANAMAKIITTPTPFHGLPVTIRETGHK